MFVWVLNTPRKFKKAGVNKSHYIYCTTAPKMKLAINDFVVTFTEEILNGKLHFLCSMSTINFVRGKVLLKVSDKAPSQGFFLFNISLNELFLLVPNLCSNNCADENTIHCYGESISQVNNKLQVNNRPCGKNRVGSLKLVNAGIYLYILVNFTICASEKWVLGIKKHNKLSFHGQFKELALFKISPLFRVVLYLGSSTKNILNL